MFVTMLMDVEDLAAPESDDAALACASILSEEGVTATMCVVGEKARLLEQRGRRDVITALQKHDIGFHTDLHSVPPSVTEFLSDKGWDDGVQEALRRERPGIESIKRILGVMPSCWGGPGNTWGPQICGAMRRLDVPAFVYAHTEAPGESVHMFAGLLAYPCGRALSDAAYKHDGEAQANLEMIIDGLGQDVRDGVFWREVFIGHPTRLMHEDFWDAVNFTGGANPPREQWRPARRRTQAEYERGLQNFRAAAQAIRDISGIEIATIRQMNAKLRGASSEPLTERERAQVWPRLEKRIRDMAGWPCVPPGISMGKIVEAARSKMTTLMRLRLPAQA